MWEKQCKMHNFEVLLLTPSVLT